MNLENIARTRVIRLEKAGINSQAVTAFRHSLKNIKESGLSTVEKRELREEAARAFMESGQSSLTEVKRAYKEAISGGGRFEGIAGHTKLSTAEMSRFLDASENQKASILASHYLSSEQIAAIRDVALEQNEGAPEDVAASFYNMLGDMVQTAYDNPGFDQAQLNDLIIELYGDSYT